MDGSVALQTCRFCQVNRNLLPPPLNLLQFLPIPGYQRRICWAVWALFSPLICAAALCVLIVPTTVCIALQAGSLPIVKNRKPYNVPVLRRLRTGSCLYKLVPRLAPLFLMILIPFIIFVSISQSVTTFLYALFYMKCGTRSQDPQQAEKLHSTTRSALKALFPLKDAESVFVSTQRCCCNGIGRN